MVEQKKEKIRKKLKGVVVSGKSSKTVIVSVGRLVKHKAYGKYVRIDKRYKAHDEKGEYKEGDKVLIEECRPFSKDKHFRVIKKI